VAFAAAVVLALSAAGTANAHMANFTGGLGNLLYYCTLNVNSNCWHGGGYTHSYYYQSVKDDGPVVNDVWTIICQPYPAPCWSDHGQDFRRLCLATHSPGGDLHCTDYDGVSYTAGILNGGGGRSEMHAAPWW
jgi:hypothetical protein